MQEKFKEEVVSFLLESGALTFGDFTLKSGRKAPYFINTGRFDNGRKITRLGQLYARHIENVGFNSVDVVFGPSYKGIPLAVAAASSLSSGLKRDIGFCFNRKEAKTRGEGGLFVGAPMNENCKVVIVEDVITAGTTLREVIPLLRDLPSVNLLGVVILVDRCEKGTGELSAVNEAKQSLGIEIKPMVSVHDILQILGKENSSGFVLDETMMGRIREYLSQYGAK